MGTFLKRLGRRWCPSPESERLSAALAAAKVQRDQRLANQDEAGKQAGWLVAAATHIENADREFGDEQYQMAWREIKAAERVMIEDPKDERGAEAKAIGIRSDGEKIGGRRGNSIRDLLCDDSGKLRTDLKADRTRIIEAAMLRDDYYDTQYYRIELRRRHLISLFFLLLGSLSLLVALAYWGEIELFDGSGPQRGTPSRLLAVILLAALGASLSVAQTIVASDINAKIPSQQVGAFMVWMRPMIGATAGVMAYVLLLANEQLKIFNAAWTEDFAAIGVIALVAGFSERFIVGALSRVADSQSGDKVKG